MIRSLLSFPLLARELTERAARKRTYVGRVAYGLVLYVLFIVALRRLVGSAESDPTGFGVLGLGRGMFQQLVLFQCWGVFLFQPALMAGVLTYEKERDSFSLLLLTGMSPTKILFEKYLAGLFPMVTLLLLALPLGAITMGYGGVSPQLLAAGACVVLAAWLQVGAFALLCSAWCRATVTAMLGAYLGGALVYLAPAISYSLKVRYILWGADDRGIDVPVWLWTLWPPEAFAGALNFQESIASAGEGDADALWAPLLGETGRLCAPILISAGVCLVLARMVMIRRGLAGPGEGRKAPGAGTARLLTSSAARWLHTLWPKHADLPQNDPIGWRESGRSFLGRQGRFLHLTLIVVGLAFALCLFLLGLYPRTAGPQRLHHLVVILTVTAVPVLSVRSVGVLLSERANQTLDLLLTTPLGAAEILRAKARALGRYWILVGLPIAVAFTTQGWSEYQYVRGESLWRNLVPYCVCDVFALLIYPPLIIWTSLLIALCLGARLRAIVAALFLFALWFIGPMTVLAFTDPHWRDTQSGLWLSLASPLGIVDATESGNLATFTIPKVSGLGWLRGWGAVWLPIVCNFAAYALLLIAVRILCLRLAESRMRRG